METFRNDGKLCLRIGKGRAQQWKHFAAMEIFRSDGKYVRGLGKVVRSNGIISQRR